MAFTWSHMSYLNLPETIPIEPGMQMLYLRLSIHLRTTTDSRVLYCMLYAVCVCTDTDIHITHSYVLNISLENKLHILIFLWLPSFGLSPTLFLFSFVVPYAFIIAVYNPLFMLRYRLTLIHAIMVSNWIGCLALIFRALFSLFN